MTNDWLKDNKPNLKTGEPYIVGAPKGAEKFTAKINEIVQSTAEHFKQKLEEADLIKFLTEGGELIMKMAGEGMEVKISAPKHLAKDYEPPDQRFN